MTPIGEHHHVGHLESSCGVVRNIAGRQPQRAALPALLIGCACHPSCMSGWLPFTTGRPAAAGVLVACRELCLLSTTQKTPGSLLCVRNAIALRGVRVMRVLLVAQTRVLAAWVMSPASQRRRTVTAASHTVSGGAGVGVGSQGVRGSGRRCQRMHACQCARTPQHAIGIRHLCITWARVVLGCLPSNHKLSFCFSGKLSGCLNEDCQATPTWVGSTPRRLQPGSKVMSHDSQHGRGCCRAPRETTTLLQKLLQCSLRVCFDF